MTTIRHYPKRPSLPNEMKPTAWFVIWLMFVVPVVSLMWWWGEKLDSQFTLSPQEEIRLESTAARAGELLQAVCLQSETPVESYEEVESLLADVEAIWPEQTFSLQNRAILRLDRLAKQSVDQQVDKPLRLSAQQACDQFLMERPQSSESYLLMAIFLAPSPEERPSTKYLEMLDRGCRLDPSNLEARYRLSIATRGTKNQNWRMKGEQRLSEAWSMERANLVLMTEYIHLLIRAKDEGVIDFLIRQRQPFELLQERIVATHKTKGIAKDILLRQIDEIAQAVTLSDWSEAQAHARVITKMLAGLPEYELARQRLNLETKRYIVDSLPVHTAKELLATESGRHTAFR